MLTNEILYANSPTAIKLHENKQNEINLTAFGKYQSQAAQGKMLIIKRKYRD